MTPTDWRELCAELANDLQEARDAVADWAAYASEYFQQKHDLQGELDRINRRLDRARAALAEPEPEVVGPTDQELADAFAEGCRDGSKAGEPPFLGGARAVLARWGSGQVILDNSAPAPADGEVQ